MPSQLRPNHVRLANQYDAHAILLYGQNTSLHLRTGCVVSPHGIDGDCNHGNSSTVRASSAAQPPRLPRFRNHASARRLTWYREPDAPCNTHNADKRDAAASSRGSSGTSPEPARADDHAPAWCWSVAWNVAVLDLAFLTSFSPFPYVLDFPYSLACFHKHTHCTAAPPSFTLTLLFLEPVLL